MVIGNHAREQNRRSRPQKSRGFYLGVDLGLMSDYTALALLEMAKKNYGFIQTRVSIELRKAIKKDVESLQLVDKHKLDPVQESSLQSEIQTLDRESESPDPKISIIKKPYYRIKEIIDNNENVINLAQFALNSFLVLRQAGII